MAISKPATLAFHFLMALAPFALICFHLYSFFVNGHITAIPLTHIFFDLFGMDILFENVGERMEFYNKVYSFLVKLPLLLWLFILAIPSFRSIYKYVED